MTAITTLILSLLLQTITITDPAHLPNPPQIPVSLAGNTLTVRLLGAAGQDWLLETRPAATATVSAFEIDKGYTNLTYPLVDVAFSTVTVHSQGDRTLGVYVQAPALTQIVVVGDTDNATLWTGTVQLGQVVSQGVTLNYKHIGTSFTGILNMLIVPHSVRTAPGRPPGNQSTFK